MTALIEVPWTTGFEDGFCGYTAAKGFCYASADAGYASVVSPAHSGQRAAAFSLTTADAGAQGQTRCVREGTLPLDAYYGAWFYLPTLPQTVDNWNLIHFQGGAGDTRWNNLWDVTLVSTDNGGFGLAVNNLMNPPNRQALGPDTPPEVPTASWFHVVFRFFRATDTSGEVTLYQDDQQLLDVKGIVTDPYPYDQWYLGNLVNATTQPELTVYVDDVSVSASR